MSDMCNSTSDNHIPPELITAANRVMDESLPDKSGKLYTQTYEEFLRWMEKNKTNSYDEVIFLVYFKELSEKISPNSLWSKYSMLRSMVSKEKNIDLSSYKRLIAFIKKQNKNYRPKKAKTFSSEEIKKFITDAPDKVYLDTKIGMIFGITGACRREELYNITISDIKDETDHLIVSLPTTKTNISRTFVINSPFREIVKNYIDLRPQGTPHDKLFLNYQNGKCTKQVIGVNKIGKMPEVVAKFLSLSETSLYTGHSFRRTSATLLANAGASITTLKRHGGWKSTACAERYIDDSTNNKKKVCHTITSSILNEESCDTFTSNAMKKMRMDSPKEMNDSNTADELKQNEDKNPSINIKIEGTNCCVQ